MKQIKHRSPKPKFCPSCKSYRIYPNSNYGFLPIIYRCKECGYEGHLTLEIEE